MSKIDNLFTEIDLYLSLLPYYPFAVINPMKVRQSNHVQNPSGIAEAFASIHPHLILVFADTHHLEDGDWQSQWRQSYPDSTILAASFSGGIAGTDEFESGWVATAIEFEQCTIRAASTLISAENSRYQVGIQLAEQLNDPTLKLVFVLSDGTNVNGSELVEGLNAGFQHKIPITGGLAGDGVRFERTAVSLNGHAAPGLVAAVGIYGDALEVGYGSYGGWDAFGVDRKVTRSTENKVFEIDHKSALRLYKEFLGDYAKDLPGSALRFPLTLLGDQKSEDVIRTIIGIDEAEESLIFAGNIPEGSMVRLMKANFDRLVDGAGIAAEAAKAPFGADSPELAVLVSCVGRKLVLGPRVEEELEEVAYVLGDQTVLTGFYSYGEICPTGKFLACSLHNQSMTITTLSEK